MEKASFAAGCFWGVEATFRKVKGVKKTTVGYEGGTTKNPTYKQVCMGTTGHAETLEIEFDPKKISYEKLLELFWNSHDPTTKNRQGPDRGTQYRSIIFYHTEKQKASAIQSKENKQKEYTQKIVTEILPATTFYRAEDYHQHYAEKHGAALCHF